MKKSIIIPCYNEINNIAKVIDKVLSKIEEGDNIIIVDDGSSDGTAQYLANLKNENGAHLEERIFEEKKRALWPGSR